MDRDALVITSKVTGSGLLAAHWPKAREGNRGAGFHPDVICPKSVSARMQRCSSPLCQIDSQDAPEPVSNLWLAWNFAQLVLHGIMSECSPCVVAEAQNINLFIQNLVQGLQESCQRVFQILFFAKLSCVLHFINELLHFSDVRAFGNLSHPVASNANSYDWPMYLWSR